MLEVFKNNQFLIRVAKDEFNEPLFCLNDVCKSLGLVDTRQSRKSIEREFEGMVFKTTPFKTEGGVQNFTMISEPQLYFLIMRSDKPNAKAFRMWVNCEVLPTIRKQGHYSIKQNQLTLKPQDGLVTPELIKALAEKGYILIDENDMKAIGEKIASSVSDGLFQILGPTRPHCLSQLNTFVYYSFWNIFLRRLRFAQSGSGFHPKWHFAQTQAPKIELRRADNCYSPIYNKWVIEDGVQDERWEWELRYKH